MMVQEGLIGVLVTKLEDYIEAHGVEHEATMDIGELSPITPTRSPSSWSPPRESLSSSLVFSPRCWSPEPIPQESPATAESPPSSSQDSAPPAEKWYLEGPSEDGCILEVLSHLTYQNIPLRPLASKATIKSFLSYLVSLRYPHNRHNYVKASKTLSSIVACKHYYNSLLEEESILRIHRELCRPKHVECSHCQRLEQTGRGVLRDAMLAAQSGLGEGEMSYRLAMAPDIVKASVALTIPHVVRQPNLLQSLLFVHNGFQCLLETLNTRIDEAVPALHELFMTLGIANPQLSVETCRQCEVGSARKEANVTFCLDDGSTVSANKESLSHNCPMFEAMFRGGFIESQQSTIRLTDITSDCLTHFTRLADEFCQCILPKDLNTLLEMITATDRFLLPELTEKIVSYIMNIALTDESCCVIYDWGLRLGPRLEITSRLAEDTLKFLFVAEMAAPRRVAAASSILAGPNRTQFIEHISQLVKTGLHSYTKMFRFLPNKLPVG